jgi:DNA-binding MarR family transcriptional regulator
MKKNEKKFDEVRKALSSLGSVHSQGVEQIMKVLDKQKLLHYSSGGEVQLFSSSGRVLYTLMDDPTITVRALAIYLDLSENMVERIIKSLITEGLITKTKYERKNVYSFNKEKIKNHPDIQRLETIITLIFTEESSEEEPF